MIRLCGVSAFLPGQGRPQILWLPADLDIPSDRSVAILGPGDAKTMLLRLLAGRARPAVGAVLHGLRMSPVINDGKLLHPALTGLENIRFLARAYGVRDRDLLGAVDAFCGIGARLPEPVRSLDGGLRRVLETAVAMMLPFDCYLLDDAQQLPAPMLARCRRAALARGAGLIFASGLGAARQHADVVLAIGDRLSLEPLSAAALANKELA